MWKPKQELISDMEVAAWASFLQSRISLWRKYMVCVAGDEGQEDWRDCQLLSGWRLKGDSQPRLPQRGGKRQALLYFEWHAALPGPSQLTQMTLKVFVSREAGISTPEGSIAQLNLEPRKGQGCKVSLLTETEPVWSPTATRISESILAQADIILGELWLGLLGFTSGHEQEQEQPEAITPRVPARPLDRRKWQRVWILIKPMAEKAESYEKMAAWLQRTHGHEGLSYSADILREIAEAGAAGLLD